MALLRPCILATVLSIASTGLASANSLDIHTDIYDAGGVVLGTSDNNENVDWVFNILDDGYDPTTEKIDSATIFITLSDNDGETHEAEAELEVGGVDVLEWDVFAGTKVVRLTAFATLNETGLLEVSLEADDSSFVFDQAKLVAHDSAVVPVPAAVWLFGSGLLGLAGFARTRNKA